MEKQTLRKQILDRVRQPEISRRLVNAADWGVLPDTGADLSAPLQQAIDRLSAEGGGVLSLGSGIYRTGALHLKSGVELHLASADTVLRFISEEPEKHYPLVLSHWEASPCYNYSALIYANEAQDIALTGCGVLDGGADADHWWNWHHQVETSWSADKPDLQLADRKALRNMNLNGVPVAERIFGAGHYLRPAFVQLLHCERVLLQGFTLRNSPMWQLNPVLCEGVTVDGVTLSSHGSNNDGCDPESCTGVWIKNCRFDTGDDCISLKSGRDRDGREANMPCQYVLIENNDFADGHGGIALGSEMSGGIHHVLASGNRFASPNLTYALRLKTNARRGGKVEQIMLCDSIMDHVHGAAVHGTMLYEDGRNGDSLPTFRDIVVENVEAHGGDYGIFLEAFPEVPITGLVLRNITIDGAQQALRSMNWEKAVVENVTINGKRFPRPGYVRVLGVPTPGAAVQASAQGCGAEISMSYTWESSVDGIHWQPAGEGQRFSVPQTGWLRVTAADQAGNAESSRAYRVLEAGEDSPARRLSCRGLLPQALASLPADTVLSRGQLAEMLVPLADPAKSGKAPADSAAPAVLLAAANGFFPLDGQGNFCPDKPVTRQELATVAMQACGVNYRNASSTMPVCDDRKEVANNYGTNAARALYFGFMELEDGCFCPKRPVTLREAIHTVNAVADFAGI